MGDDELRALRQRLLRTRRGEAPEPLEWMVYEEQRRRYDADTLVFNRLIQEDLGLQQGDSVEYITPFQIGSGTLTLRGVVAMRYGRLCVRVEDKTMTGGRRYLRLHRGWRKIAHQA